MRIRTQLIAAAFVLAVIPLAAIVLWSHHSSREALELAYRRETERLARQMDRRLTGIRADLDRRLTVVSALPIPNAENREGVGDIVSVMGEAASLVDALEFRPLPAPKPAAGKTVIAPAKSPATKPAETSPRERPADEIASAGIIDPVDLSELEAELAEVAVPEAPRAPVVIDIPAIARVTRYVMSEKQKEIIAEISELGTSLSDPELDPEEREDLRAEMRAAQRELQRIVGEERARRQADSGANVRELLREQARVVRSLPAPHKAVVQHRAAPAPAPAPAAPGAVAATPAVEPAPSVRRADAATEPAVRKRTLTATQVAEVESQAKKTSLILGRKFATPVRKEGEVVGQLTAQIRPEQVIQRVLGGAVDEASDEIPFAIDREGTVYARSEAQRQQLERLGIVERLGKGKVAGRIEGWIVSTTTDPQSGLRIGVARPVGETFDELRRTAARNFGIGMGLIAFALIGIVPLSNHLTRDVLRVTEGAERIASGDLMTRLPVKTNNEMGQLARAFNRMAEDLSSNQQQLLEQERARKEQEMQQRILSIEYERKSFELEEARRFQLSMLPKEVPQFESYEIAVYTRTATEVGGDYYDFHHADDVLSITIGDATGHGAKAGTMVTVIKTLFAGYDGMQSPSAFLGDAAEKIKRMDLGRMAMSLSLARLEKGQMTLASAGMPPVMIHRAASGQVEELALGATPLGTFGSDYPEACVKLCAGDTVLFMSDGFPELLNDAGQQLGYIGAAEAFAASVRKEGADSVITSLAEHARRWHGDAPPNDDVTFVVIRA